MIKVTKLLAMTLLTIGVIFLAGCGNTEETPQATAEVQAQANNGLPSRESPIVVNKEEGTIIFAAEVNGKYFYEPTRHAAVFEGGSNGEKAIFRGLAETEPFYNALLEIGAKAGENMTLENKETTNVQGDALDVTVFWDGAEKEYKLDQVINDSNGKPIEMRFGGNIANSLDKKTGCLLCLDSCPVGIVSNASYTYGAVEKRKEVAFTGNKELLPEDGTLVYIKLKIKQ